MLTVGADLVFGADCRETEGAELFVVLVLLSTEDLVAFLEALVALVALFAELAGSGLRSTLVTFLAFELVELLRLSTVAALEDVPDDRVTLVFPFVRLSDAELVLLSFA